MNRLSVMINQQVALIFQTVAIGIIFNRLLRGTLSAVLDGYPDRVKLLCHNSLIGQKWLPLVDM